MDIEKKIQKLESMRYRIKQIEFKIKELRETYMPPRSLEGIPSHSSGGSSPQERIVAKIDQLERELEELRIQAFELNEEIYAIIESIKDQKARWIVTQRFKGKAWSEIECGEYSTRHMQRIYKQTVDSLEAGEYGSGV